jgi:tRNA dimethylallyltransferase
MLVYRGMNIGTAKPTPEERGDVAYYGIDLVDPDASFSVGGYLAAVQASLPEDGEFIVAGGTGLFVRCLLQGLDPVPAANHELRERAEAILEEAGVAGLQRELLAKAPAVYEQVRDKENPRRLIRALEKAEAGTSAVGGWQGKPGPLVGLRTAPDVLARRIWARVQAMFRGGLLDEARRLRDGPPLSKTALQAIGYAEAFAVLDGKMNEASAMDQAATRTRQLAKRQMTWFRNQANVDWIDVDDGADGEAVANRVESAWKKYGPIPLSI